MTKEEILRKLQEHVFSVEEATKMLNELEVATKAKGLYCKVSEKGGVSVYGLSRFPVTLYVEQWNRLLEFVDELKRFIQENDAKLKRKEK